LDWKLGRQELEKEIEIMRGQLEQAEVMREKAIG